MPEKLKNISQVNLRSRRGPVVLGDVVYRPGGICGPRLQRDYQLVVIHRGRLDLLIDGRKVFVPAGKAILLSPRHREFLRFAEECETHHSWCAVQPGAVPVRLRRRWKRSPGPILFPAHLGRLLDLGKKQSQETDELEELASDFYLGLGIALLSGFVHAVEKGETVGQRAAETVAKVDAFISNEFPRKLSLSDLARAGGVSRQHLLKIFRERELKSPRQYLFSRRVDAATTLLSHTGLSLGEIAERCGFVNAFHFSRKFKELCGVNPRAWRKDQWAGP